MTALQPIVIYDSDDETETMTPIADSDAETEPMTPTANDCWYCYWEVEGVTMWIACWRHYRLMKRLCTEDQDVLIRIPDEDKRGHTCIFHCIEVEPCPFCI